MVGERDDWKSWGSKQEVRNEEERVTIRGRDSDGGLRDGQKSGLDLRRSDNSINLDEMKGKGAHTIRGTASHSENMWYMVCTQHTQHGWRWGLFQTCRYTYLSSTRHP